MTIKREYRKSNLTPEQRDALRAEREMFQREKLTPDEALAQSGLPDFMPLGELLEMHKLLAELKRERLRQKLTLAEIEERTGISEATLSRLETGKASNPTLDTIYRISTALGKVLGFVMQDASSANGKGSAHQA